MKKIAILGLISMSSAFADNPIIDVIEIPVKHEHRVNFGLLNVGYERIKSDSVYVGGDVKLNPIWNATGSGDNEYRLDHYINAEFRIGYNHSFSLRDSVTPYFGLAHTLYSLKKIDGNTKHLSSASVGIKYLHAFGETFEMGLHIKGSIGFYHQRYQLDDEKEYLVSVKTGDSVWVPEFGLPMNWHVGVQKNWEIQFEPYYMQIPNAERAHLLGSRLALGYRF